VFIQLRSFSLTFLGFPVLRKGGRLMQGSHVRGCSGGCHPTQSASLHHRLLFRKTPETRQKTSTKKLAQLDKDVKAAQSSADNAWMLVSAALVLMMTGPGLALFYGGLVRRKNTLAIMMQALPLMR